MTKSSVELRNVSFTYAGFDAPAIKDVSFAVAPGECVVLCGESGCGKTTATRIVNGLAGGFYEGCVLSSSRRQNRRYDFDTFSVLRADRLSYF